MKQNRLAITGILFFAASCTSAPKFEDGISHQASHETLVIIGTNDIHGALAPITFKTKESDGTESVTYERGGAAVLASHLEILRGQYGDRLLWLDAGDEFQGSIESNLEAGAPMVQFFNYAGLHAAAVGNHEFDFGLDALRARMVEAKYPYLAANIVEKSSQRLPAWQNLATSRVINRGGIQVGVIGLTTRETPTVTRAEHVSTLAFTDLKEAAIREAQLLRSQGAEIVVITAHVGIRCTTPPGALGHRMRKPTDPQGVCSEKDEMTRLLKSLPQGTVDAVVSGHTHSIVHHYVAGTPVVQGGSRGHHYNLIYVTFDRSQRKVVPDLTRIEGPIQVCPKVFRNQQDCSGDTPAPVAKGRGRLVTPQLHGSSVRPDSALEQLLAPVFQKSEKEKKRLVGIAARAVEHARTEESPMGNLIADALRASTQADAALINTGGIRAGFEPGPITYEALFRVLPFDNFVSVLTLTGAELKTLVRISQNGSRGYFPTSGLKLRVLHPSLDPKTTDLNADGKVEPWEADRLISVQFADGSKIQDSKKYKLATLDFLVTGGDDLGWFMSRLPAERIQLTAGPTIRDVVEASLKGREPLNSTAVPLIDPARPRLTFVKVDQVKRRSRRRR